ncbi:uncharacterized protein LOC103577179 isoform X2 [Microplitis demolitor]|uniref:uncharacterized protein LOC103577179 isoform X2 n=1 Tax=Microplitis demolitor TaxID=69319 RepID=UPI00235B6629|nr:uncharacterized protein LOC103577179 isoform X2 [Microplitis demolitor]
MLINDTVKNIIKEEFDIKSDPGESYHVNYYDSSIVPNSNDDLGLNDVNNEETTYASLKTVDFERLSSLKSFHTSPVKSSTEKSHQDFYQNDLSSPRKLGASKKRRSSKTCKRNSKNFESSEETNIFNNEMTVVNNTDNVEKELDLKEFISDVENENIFLTQMILQDNESIGDNIDNVEKEIDVKESMSIDIDYLKNETADQTPITPEKNNEEIVNSTDNLDREINIKECIDNVPIDNIFSVPITPEKNNNGHEENDPLYITPIKELDSKKNNVLNNLTPSILEDKLDSDGEYDKICNEKLSTLCQNDSKAVCSDSEFERMCDTIKSNNYEPARFSFETIELLNEFNDLDQSTNNNLLAELLTTPVTHGNKKNQDYMITIDPLIDSSTSINSVSDTSDDSDLGIEIKSRHIRKLIASNAQRKKFLRANRKSCGSLNNVGIENKDENKFDKRKKRTKKMINNSRRKRLKSNEMSSFEDDDSDDSNGDKVDNILQESTSEFKVKRKRTRKVYNNLEQRRSSRLLEKSVNIKNINEDIEESLGDTSRKINKTDTEIVRKNRKSFSRLKKPSNNTANQSIAEMDLDNNLPTDFKNTIIENNEEYFASEKIMTNIKRERSDSIDNKFFSDDESQRNYEELTNTSIINQKFIIDDGVDTEVIKKRRVRKKVPSDFVRRSSSRIREKSRDDRDIDDKENHENIRVNPDIENQDFKGKKKQGESMGRGRGRGRKKSIKIEEQSCDDADEYENIGDDRPLKLRIKLKNRGTNKAGRKSLKVEEFDDEHQSDTKEMVGGQNLIEKHTPSRIKINGKYEDKQISRSKSISVKSEPEISDAADDYDSDSSGLPSSEMSMISEESEVEIVEEKIQRIGPKILNKFINLEVELEHEVPIQHQLETSLLKPMTEELKCLFGKYSKLERQNFRLEEDKIIQRNWNRFCEVHDLDPSCAKILLERHNNRKRLLLAYMKDKIKLVQFLARDLPNRLLHQVCKRFRALYRGTKQKNYYKSKSTRKRFTSKDDRLIIVYITQNQSNIEKSCKELAELLGQTESAVLSRYHYLKDRKARVRKGRQLIEWDVPLTEKYIKNLMELTLSDEVEELKYAKIPKVVWIEMEKKMNIPKSKLMQFWHCQLHMQLFHPKCIISSELRIMLIEYLYVKGISTRREIDWTVVAQHFDGATNEGLSRLFSSMVAMSPFPDKENLSEVIEWLYEVKIPRIMRAKNDNYLPRLIYKDGKIEVIDDYPYERDTKLD